MLAIVIRIIITVYGCLTPFAPLKHMPRLIHCPTEKIREGKIYANSLPYFGEVILSTAAEWISMRAAGFRTPWHLVMVLNCLDLGNTEIFRVKTRKA